MKLISAVLGACALGVVPFAAVEPAKAGMNCKDYSYNNSTTCHTENGTYEIKRWSHDNSTTITGPDGSTTNCRRWSHDNSYTCN